MGHTETDRIKQNAPGPWGYEVSTNDPDYFEVRCDDSAIALVERWNDDENDHLEREAEANAALIAAAPDLLEAARIADRLCKLITEWADIEQSDASSLMDIVVDIARGEGLPAAAITKAMGDAL